MIVNGGMIEATAETHHDSKVVDRRSEKRQHANVSKHSTR